MFLNWSEPIGERSFYLVKWRNETAELSKYSSDTHVNVTELTPGEKYCFHVAAVAGENKTESDEEIKCQHTSKILAALRASFFVFLVFIDLLTFAQLKINPRSSQTAARCSHFL